MIAVVVALLVLYVRSGLSLWGAWQTSRVDAAKVHALQVQHSRLQRQRDKAGEGWFAEMQARRLGLAHKGDKPYVVRGLPHD
jgi:hypothetical protein